MAKSALDVSLLASVIMRSLPDLHLASQNGFKGMRIGFLDPKVCHLQGNDICDYPGDVGSSIESAFHGAVTTISSLGAETTCDIELPQPGEQFSDKGKSMSYEHCSKYSGFSPCHIHYDVAPQHLGGNHNLEQMVAWNQAHSELSARSKEGLDPILRNVDVLVALSDSSLCSYSSAAGYPMACVPLCMAQYSEENQRPVGLCLTASEGGEQVLLRFIQAFERAFPHRTLPRPLTG